MTTKKIHPYLLQDEVQVDALLPVDVGVSEAGQLLRVPPVDLHLHLKCRQYTASGPDTRHTSV